MQDVYDIVYSLGRDCACSKYMRNNRLRIVSGSFDWLTNASFNQRLELNFKQF